MEILADLVRNILRTYTGLNLKFGSLQTISSKQTYKLLTIDVTNRARVNAGPKSCRKQILYIVNLVLCK